MPIWEYIGSMARAATTSDAFNAMAEPRRRDILNYLALEERSVSEIVDVLEMEQPSVSKHLRVRRGVSGCAKGGPTDALPGERDGDPAAVGMDYHL